MGGRRKFARASRPPSVWDVDHLRRELENIDVDWRHGEALLTYLAHHPEVTTWADVNWAALKRRVPQKLPAFLEDAFSVRSTRVASRHDSKDGTTTKVVVELRDGAEVEAVVAVLRRCRGVIPDDAKEAAPMTLAEARRCLKKAVAQLVAGDASVEVEVERWDAVVRGHPEYVAEQAARR